MTVFNDTETATYTHTLTVTGRLGGLYQCNVSNSKPSEAVAILSVEGDMSIIIMYIFFSTIVPKDLATCMNYMYNI